MSKNMDRSRKEAEFAPSALMEIPSQHKATLELLYHLLNMAHHLSTPQNLPIFAPTHHLTITTNPASARIPHPSSEYQKKNLYNFAEASRQLKNHKSKFVVKDVPVENENHDNVGSASILAKITSDDNPGIASTLDDSLYEGLNSYQPHQYPFDDNETENGISSVGSGYKFRAAKYTHR